MVKEGEEGRVDRYLAFQFPDWSRTMLQRLINKRHVLIDGHPASPKNKLRVGQKITIDWPQAPKATKKTIPKDLPFQIVMEDESVIVINKPPGLVVHPSAGHNHGITLVELVEPRLSKGLWPDETRPGLVHRLDRDTSGVIIMAKTPEAHSNLSKQFAHRQVKKTYLALVKGVMTTKEGTLECYIDRHPGKRQRFAVSSSKGRWASTKFTVEKIFGELATQVRLFPLTGRTHQLRVQLSSLGFAILGDHVYGVTEKEFEFVPRQMLHACELTFRHPDTQKMMTVEAPLPTDFQDVLKVIRLRTSS
jgi:23S rRNA pseudouridine1911/1915/1917 synthase